MIEPEALTECPDSCFDLDIIRKLVCLSSGWHDILF